MTKCEAYNKMLEGKKVSHSMLDNGDYFRLENPSTLCIGDGRTEYEHQCSPDSFWDICVASHWQRGWYAIYID